MRMPIELFFLGILLLLTVIAFIPEIFPVCSCCGKKKFRAFIKISKAVKIHPGYSGSKSVCRKCCRLYGIETLQDLKKVLSIRRKIEINLDIRQSRIPSQTHVPKTHPKRSRRI